MPVLSPSWDLFGRYRNAVKNGTWNEDFFQSIYVPQFLQEMKYPAARRALNGIYLADKQSRRMALVCFCNDESLCHRSILAGLLQGVGCDVTTPTGKDYSRYYEMLKGMIHGTDRDSI